MRLSAELDGLGMSAELDGLGMGAERRSEPHPSRLVSVVSGKGGVGKTSLSVNLAVAAARSGARVLLVDGDLGLANVDVLLGLLPRASAADVVSGSCRFEDAVLEGPAGLHVLPAASGRPDLLALRPSELSALILPLLASRHEYDLILVDAGAGIGTAVLSLAAASDQVLLVTSEEPTALADAYATLKVLGDETPVSIVVNAAKNLRRARSTHAQLARMSERFLGSRPELATWLPVDARVGDAVSRQTPLVELHPLSPVATRIVELARALVSQAS